MKTVDTLYNNQIEAEKYPFSQEKNTFYEQEEQINEATIERNANDQSYTCNIHSLNDFIPDGLENDIIQAMRSIPGVNVSGTDGDYNYVQKPNTNTVVEILTLEFVRARKRAGA
jgi:outer membrane receptor for ferrienterochelin and colicin